MAFGFEEALTFGLLTLALAALWLPARGEAGGGPRRWVGRLWLAALGAAGACGLLFGFLDGRGVLAIGAMGVASWGFYRPQGGPALRCLFGFGVVVLSVGLALHLLPGFENPKVLSEVVLTPDAVPYSKYLNFDKAVIGLFLVAFGQRLIVSRPEWRRALGKTVPVAAGTIVVVLILSSLLGYVRFEPAVPPHVLLWAWTNLFFTCIAEEAIFRGFLQRALEQGFASYRFGAAVALVMASVLFGLAHWAGGPKYVLLSTVAGLGYGLAMQRSGRIEGSILTHFALNGLHYLFFSYPALASAVP